MSNVQMRQQAANLYIYKYQMQNNYIARLIYWNKYLF